MTCVGRNRRRPAAVRAWARICCGEGGGVVSIFWFMGIQGTAKDRGLSRSGLCVIIILSRLSAAFICDSPRTPIRGLPWFHP